MIYTDGIRTIANAGRDPELATEQRLEREAQAHLIATFCAPGCDTAFNATDVVKVEVTRGNFVDDEGFDLRENAGHYIVFVSTTPGGEHPATIASDAVVERFADEWDYFSVDDVFAH